MDSELFPLPEDTGLSPEQLAENLMELVAAFNPVRHDPPTQMENGRLAIRIYFNSPEELNAAESWHYMRTPPFPT